MADILFTLKLNGERDKLTSYERYNLRDNPFPQGASVIPDSDDIRVNGTIFVEEVFKKKELENFRRMIQSQTNLIYLEGHDAERGVGKSALLVNEWRACQAMPNTPTAYVRCNSTSPYNRPSDFATSIISQMHDRGWLWKSFQKNLTSYTIESGVGKLNVAELETMFQVIRWPVEYVNLTLYTHVRDRERLSRDFAKWLHERNGLSPEFTVLLSSAYLEKPLSFWAAFSRRKGVDKIELYGNVLKFLQFAGFGPCYFFLDQWEYAVTSAKGGKLQGFCSDMRRMLELSINKATLVATLHPDGERLLNGKAGEDLMALAPFDKNHAVDIYLLEPNLRSGTKSHGPILLAGEYMKYFRVDEKSESLIFPFDGEAISYICFLKNGRIRDLLQQLHQALKYGAENGYPFINMEFVKSHHLETTGEEFDEEQYRLFSGGGS
jgi:hypothetical protein